MKFDVLVLGAGIVGVSVAIHLQRRGLKVALVDRKAPGSETSFGNAGLIQRDGVYPYAFPRDVVSLLRYASNQAPDVRYHVAAVPQLLPFLYRYWRWSRADRHAAIAKVYAPLIQRSVGEHRALIDSAGAAHLLRTGGWLKVFRSGNKLEAEARTVERLHAEFDVRYEVLGAAELRAAEPFLSNGLTGAVRYTNSCSITDPNALVMAYAGLFKQLGGRIFLGDANTLKPNWAVETQEGTLEARSAVVAMGPWSDTITAQLGYRLPLAVKRGYHMHYAAEPGARLNQPVLDVEKGYLMAPMARGIRLTTGVELGLRDTGATPAQLEAVEPVARGTFPLGERLDDTPWLGRRPCTPDMLPIIGPAPRHKDLWFAFGHAHHGLTLGPVTGSLLAEMMTGEKTLVDPYPFRVDRF